MSRPIIFGSSGFEDLLGGDPIGGQCQKADGKMAELT